jgi:hypothetical protein
MSARKTSSPSKSSFEAEELLDLRARVAQLTAQVQTLMDQAAIRDVLRRYARGLDRHDVELETSAFWPDAQVNYGVYSGERDAFVKWGNEGHEKGYRRHEHHITNQTIDIDGDTAHVESYVIYLLHEIDEKTTEIGGARYIDRMERRDGEWRIILREFLPDIYVRAPSFFTSAFVKQACPPSGAGTWDKTDLSYVRPLQKRPEPET